MNTGAKNYPNFPHDDCRGYILLIDDEDVVVDVAKQVPDTMLPRAAVAAKRLI